MFNSIGLVIIAELETHAVTIGSASAQRVDRSQKDANGVTAANGVGILLQVRGKTLVIQSLNDFHALEIKIRHRLEFIIAENVTLNKVKLQFVKLFVTMHYLAKNVNKLSRIVNVVISFAKKTPKIDGSSAKMFIYFQYFFAGKIELEVFWVKKLVKLKEVLDCLAKI